MENTEIVVICAVCGVEIARKPGHGVSGISHGYCNEHGRELLAGLKEKSDAVH